MRATSLLSVLLSGALLAAAVEAAPALGAGPAAPRVTGLSSSSGRLAGGAHVVVKGSGFAGTRTVLVGKATAHVLKVTPGAVTIVVPRHKPGRVDIRVVTSNGKSAAVRADRFTYVAPPVVTRLSAVATRVTVKGKNFSHVKAVLFGKAKGTKVHVVSSTTLLVTAPSHSPGTVDVRVRTAYGTSKTGRGDHFTYTATTSGPPTPSPPGPAPTIASLTLPDATQGTPYAGATFTATSGAAPYTWTAHGLPGGLSLSAGGVLSGTTYAATGIKALRVTLTDATGRSVMSLVTLRVVARAGQLFGWGPNTHGTLGNGNQTTVLTPSGNLAGAGTISQCSEKTNGFLANSSGAVYGWGLNNLGQLGDLSTTAHPSPILVSAGFGVVAVACADDTMYELTSNGQVYALGSGSMGETGTGSTSFNATPNLIPSLSHVVAIAAGENHALALLDSGAVYAWGDNHYGQLGVGASAGTLSAAPLPVPGLTDITEIAAGGWFSFALHSDGTVSGWGVDNPYVFLGDDATDTEYTPVTIPHLSNITQLATSGSASFAVEDNGALWAWGTGQLGNGTAGAAHTPVQVLASGIAAVATSQDDAFALTTTGAALAWGSGAGTGHNDPASVTTPTAAPWLDQTVSVGLGRDDAFVISLKALEA
jgi:alpha-tubulin suppressor-like RCC1 family protein